MAISSPLQFARRHVGLFRERYIRSLCSCAKFQYTHAKAGVVHWSAWSAWSAAVESKRKQLGHRCTLYWPSAPYAHTRPQVTDVRYACRTVKRVLAALAHNDPPRRNRDHRATTSPSPYPRTPHRRDFGKTELMWCARQDAFASLHFRVGHLPLQRKTSD